MPHPLRAVPSGGGGGISVPTLYMRKLEPGGGEACSRSLSQGAVKRGPEVWRVSHKSLQTRFLQLPPPPPDQCLGPDQKASAAALSDVRGSPGGGAAPLQIGLRQEPRSGVWRRRGAQCEAGCVDASWSPCCWISSAICLLLGRWAQGGHRGLVDPQPLFNAGGSQAQRGRHTASGHTATRPSWAGAQ